MLLLSIKLTASFLRVISIFLLQTLTTTVTDTYHNRHTHHRHIIKMGYEVTSFVGEVDKEFVCPICMMVVEKPLVSPCEHIFCAKCIVEWVTQDNSCPVDRQALQMSNLKAAPRYYRNLWSKLNVKCQLRKSLLRKKKCFLRLYNFR